MKKVLLAITVMVSTLVSSSMVFASAWNVPTNVRIVQKSNTDTTGRIYGTIQAAINSITNASASNPYVVKVMPGIYDQGTASLQMKEYVDLEGSGDNTVITSANINVDGDTCTAGTVLMSNNSTIRNVRVVNTGVDAGNNNIVAGVIFNNVNAKAEGISALVGSDSAIVNTAGICSFGSTAKATLNNVTVEVRGGVGSSWAEALQILNDGSATVTNSKFAAFMAGNTTHVLDCRSGINMTGTLTVINSTIEGTTSPAGNNRGITNAACTASISNSIVKVNGGDGIQTYGTSTTSIVNTQVLGSTTGIYFGGDTTAFVNVANSLIQGTVPTYQSNVKLFNNYTEAFLPINYQP